MTITILKSDGTIIVSGNYSNIRMAVEDCVQRNISLAKAYLAGADLREANLQGADLRGACLFGANLSAVDLSRVNLGGADLRLAYLWQANLSAANLSDANLSFAKLSSANLSGAKLYRAHLYCAFLFNANLSGADLSDADLSRVDLSGADLCGTNLSDANVFGTILSDAILPDFQLCPQGQAFVAYKKLRNDLIATLEIPEDVPRTSSLVGRRCRAQSARIISIEAPDGTLVSEGASLYDDNFIYRTGEIVSETSYNPDIQVECTQGVHFFMAKEEAQKYRY